MAVEIERKFQVKGDSWRQDAAAQRRRLARAAKSGVSRFEYEYRIPVEDAAEMLEFLCERPLIEKIRHHVTVNGREWVIDVFEGDNAGLVVAEVEFEDEAQAIELPDWAGEEVTDDPRSYNVNLAKHPYRLWEKPLIHEAPPVHDSAAGQCYREHTAARTDGDDVGRP